LGDVRSPVHNSGHFGRLLSPSDFGLMGMIMVVIGFAQAFADMGISNARMQRNINSQVFTGCISLRVSSSFAAYARPLRWSLGFIASRDCLSHNAIG